MDAPAKVKENGPDHWRIPPLQADGHKYTRGAALVFGGAVMTGASRLSALAAARAGAGLVTLAAPEVAWPIYAASLLSVIARPLAGVEDWNALVADTKTRAILIGPGAGRDALPHAALATALRSGEPTVLDADALGMLAADAGLRALATPSPYGETRILTPHEGEYAQLAAALGLDTAADKPTRALALAQALHAVVVLKGEDTMIASPDGRVLVNHAHAPWLATGGTGDVLAGIITGLLAQGMDAFDAACAGVWIHGETAQKLGRGMLAEDLLGEIPGVLRGIA
ncbi:MAG: NAD(P)H-hydrate dehydratase [Rickettsiales bacterium]